MLKKKKKKSETRKIFEVEFDKKFVVATAAFQKYFKIF